MLESLIIALFALLGVVTQRIVGFGIAAFLAPVALIFFSPPVAVVSTILVGTFSVLLILFQTRRKRVLEQRIIFRLWIPGIPGLLLGSLIVTHIDKSLLQMALGVLVIAAVLIQEYAMPRPNRPLAATKGISVAGFSAGLLSASAANGALPIIMWMRTHSVNPEQIRQNFAAIALLFNLCSITAIHFIRPDFFNMAYASIFLYLIPAVLLGNFIGGKLLPRIDKTLYERLVVAAIIVNGLVSFSIGLSTKV